MKVTDNLQSELKDGMLELASGKAVPVMMNCVALSDPEKINSFRLPTLREATTPYHPMCNGQVKRFNATLKTCVRRLCGEQPRQGHRYINPLVFAYREVPQESTHFAPFELLYERTVQELGGWGSNETVNDLEFGDQLTPDQRRQLEEIASSYSSIFSDRPGTVSTKEHRIDLTSQLLCVNAFTPCSTK
ncbi:zinc finger protein [Elysia marginata]|uniref:Zinc finger protein n=1 Tax=Elysia marginata TaxID=1093978 RepID=A0AAV4HAT8_9GAST|nr:zinc finger protein [Elysia marginata]